MRPTGKSRWNKAPSQSTSGHCGGRGLMSRGTAASPGIAYLPCPLRPASHAAAGHLRPRPAGRQFLGQEEDPLGSIHLCICSLAPSGELGPDGPLEMLLDAYRRYLVTERGLAPSTVEPMTPLIRLNRPIYHSSVITNSARIVALSNQRSLPSAGLQQAGMW